MTAYGFSDSKYYTCPVNCQIDPLTPGRWLLPWQATPTPPPTPPSGQVLQYNAATGSWTAVTPPAGTVPDPGGGGGTMPTPPPTPSNPTLGDTLNNVIVSTTSTLLGSLIGGTK